MGLTALVWFNFAWFREQLCIIVCPYGRLQSVLLDKQSLIIGYDEKRGEPRGKKLHVVASDSRAVGDCVDCHRCVAEAAAAPSPHFIGPPNSSSN